MSAHDKAEPMWELPPRFVILKQWMRTRCASNSVSVIFKWSERSVGLFEYGERNVRIPVKPAQS